MKRTLLFAALSFSLLGNAQSLTQANEPAIGETSNMYLCDSFTVAYDGIVGTGVTWDYTGLVGITGQTRLVSVLDATTHANAADFPTSTKVISVESSMSSFINSTATERVSQGFVFNEPSLGDIVSKFDVDNEIVVTYPFAYGSTLTDIFSGDVTTGQTGTTATTGVTYATIDGQGTLNLPFSVSIPNVIRYKIIDTSYTTVLLLGDLEIIRRQYEYYDLANNNLPILTLSKLTIQAPGSTTPISDLSLVLSAYVTAEFLSISENKAIDFRVYPNPSKDIVNINGNFSQNAIGKIIDQSGRILSSFEVNDNATIDLSSFENGMYFLKIIDNELSTTKTLIKE